MEALQDWPGNPPRGEGCSAADKEQPALLHSQHQPTLLPCSASFLTPEFLHLVDSRTWLVDMEGLGWQLD